MASLELVAFKDVFLENVRYARDEHFCHDSHLRALGFVDGLYWSGFFKSASERFRLEDLVRNAHQVRLRELLLEKYQRREELYKETVQSFLDSERDGLPLPIVEEEQMEFFE